MTAKHDDPEYRSNARIIRQRVKAIHKTGEAVPCWRCGRPIHPGQPFDVGHRDRHAGHGLGNLAPEHRHASAWCKGNRSDGGTHGATTTNARHRVPAGEVTTWKL